ncbi:hypothetical protein PAL_GLEAN10020612 [Pteropus alecto]|uniref:Uncharacterized protein n=1 Tax=Pteropus alecto TaxID=9402 RepID=L5JNU5_PTEAL|nr:hypothetical protein PAL_GLEAN10020612 [Pteropus alecto]
MPQVAIEIPSSSANHNHHESATGEVCENCSGISTPLLPTSMSYSYPQYLRGDCEMGRIECLYLEGMLLESVIPMERQENVYLLENAGLERESYVYTNTGETQRQLEQTGHPATEVSGFLFSSLLS